MSWKGVITDAGAELMTRWAANSTLKLSGAFAGTGTVEESALMSQASLVESKQTASLVSRTAVENGTKVKVQVVAPDAGYVLNQIGIFATVDDGEAVLFAIYQNASGVLMPSSGEAPDFVYSLFCTLTVSNQGDISVVLDSAALVSHSSLDEAIAEHNCKNGAHMDIRDALEKNAYKIGDIKITARDIDDEEWLLCDSTKVSEEASPELYHMLSSKIPVFKGVWPSESVTNNGIAPIYADDGYLYFVQDGNTWAARCKPDFSEYEEYTLPYSGGIRYVNGVWFVIEISGYNATVHYSSDCFKSDLNEPHRFVLTDDSGSSTSRHNDVKFYDNEWHFMFMPYKSHFKHFKSATLDGTFEEVPWTGFKASGGTGYIVSIFNYKDKIYATGASYPPSAVTDGTEGSYILKADTDGGWSYLYTSYGSQLRMSVKYIPELDVVWLREINQIMNANENLISFFAHDSFAFYKGYMYVKNGTNIHRYNIDEVKAYFNEEGVTPSQVISSSGTNYKISASPDRLYMPKDSSTMYYIENEAEIDIPAAHPGTIFKTYIKCK